MHNVPTHTVITTFEDGRVLIDSRVGNNPGWYVKVTPQHDPAWFEAVVAHEDMDVTLRRSFRTSVEAIAWGEETVTSDLAAAALAHFGRCRFDVKVVRAAALAFESAWRWYEEACGPEQDDKQVDTLLTAALSRQDDLLLAVEAVPTDALPADVREAVALARGEESK
jgi:hypothetical protein